MEWRNEPVLGLPCFPGPLVFRKRSCRLTLASQASHQLGPSTSHWHKFPVSPTDRDTTWGVFETPKGLTSQSALGFYSRTHNWQCGFKCPGSLSIQMRFLWRCISSSWSSGAIQSILFYCQQYKNFPQIGAAFFYPPPGASSPHWLYSWVPCCWYSGRLDNAARSV